MTKTPDGWSVTVFKRSHYGDMDPRVSISHSEVVFKTKEEAEKYRATKSDRDTDIYSPKEWYFARIRV